MTDICYYDVTSRQISVTSSFCLQAVKCALQVCTQQPAVASYCIDTRQNVILVYRSTTEYKLIYFNVGFNNDISILSAYQVSRSSLTQFKSLSLNSKWKYPPKTGLRWHQHQLCQENYVCQHLVLTNQTCKGAAHFLHYEMNYVYKWIWISLLAESKWSKVIKCEMALRLWQTSKKCEQTVKPQLSFWKTIRKCQKVNHAVSV